MDRLFKAHRLMNVLFRSVFLDFQCLVFQRNNIQMIHEDTFCNLKDFNYIRNALEDIRLDGNPINLSRTPQAYVCLPRVPIGAHI